MSVIVTGASGQLGRLVIDQLLATVPASEVTAVVRDPAKAGDLAARGVTLAVADYNSPESFDGLLRDGDRVLLISGSEMHRDRVAQHKAVLGAAVKAGVALLAYTSAPGSQGGPVTDDHRATEDAIRTSGVPYSLLRNGLYHEMVTMNIPAALERGALVRAAGDGGSPRHHAPTTPQRRPPSCPAAATRTRSTSCPATPHGASPSSPPRSASSPAARSLPCRHRRGVRGDAVRRRAARPAPDVMAGIDASIAAGELALTTGDLSRLARPATPVADAIAAALAR